jgi:hypothetical protein
VNEANACLEHVITRPLPLRIGDRASFYLRGASGFSALPARIIAFHRFALLAQLDAFVPSIFTVLSPGGCNE